MKLGKGNQGLPTSGMFNTFDKHLYHAVGLGFRLTLKAVPPSTPSSLTLDQSESRFLFMI